MCKQPLEVNERFNVLSGDVFNWLLIDEMHKRIIIMKEHVVTNRKAHNKLWWHLSLWVHVLYSTCTVHVHVLYMYCTCTVCVHVLCVYMYMYYMYMCTFSVHVFVYMLFTYLVSFFRKRFSFEISSNDMELTYFSKSDWFPDQFIWYDYRPGTGTCLENCSCLYKINGQFCSVSTEW